MDGATLGGVSATALWTLRNRAVHAAGPDPWLIDPWAVTLYESIRYDWDRFGSPSPSHALRATAVDTEIRRYLAERPGATVVALGEGLQTTLWRVDPPKARWLAVDLAAVMELRAQLLPGDERVTPLALSATDRAWFDAVGDPEAGVFLCAEGLFMYLDEADVVALIAECAERFPGGRLLFDSIPPWFSRRTMRGFALSDRFTAPPMPTGLTPARIRRELGALPGVARVEGIEMPLGRGVWGSRTLRAVGSIPPLPQLAPSMHLLTFAER
ncbi:class I SAM-dependent methyltransferase [Pseudonocardia sp. NPDC046786]|uniref:class I SAM-dependent methyltransferase n=1 Tax=Pseudonocardia sp. NPDC046786 TaxID=3155471 RepID=UPI0033C7B203